MVPRRLAPALFEWAAEHSESEIRDKLLPRIRREQGIRDDSKLASLIREYLVWRQDVVKEAVRTGALKCLLVLLPHSREAIARLILECDFALHGEIRFSLLCLMSDPTYIGASSSDAFGLLQSVCGYMKKAKHDCGLSLWMAGHLLSAHLSTSVGVPLLLDVVRHGRYVEGRRTALVALGACFSHADGRTRRQIVRAVESVRRGDRSRTLRTWARIVKEECTKPLAGSGRAVRRK